MGALALCLASEAEGQGGSSAVLSADAAKAGTQPLGKSAEIVNHPRLNLAEARAVLRRHARDVIFAAFPERSQHATCIKAAMACGVSPDKIERLIGGDTPYPDVLVLGFCAGIVRNRTCKPTPICRVLAQVMGETT